MLSHCFCEFHRWTVQLYLVSTASRQQTKIQRRIGQARRFFLIHKYRNYQLAIRHVQPLYHCMSSSTWCQVTRTAAVDAADNLMLCRSATIGHVDRSINQSIDQSVDIVYMLAAAYRFHRQEEPHSDWMVAKTTTRRHLLWWSIVKIPARSWFGQLLLLLPMVDPCVLGWWDAGCLFDQRHSTVEMQSIGHVLIYLQTGDENAVYRIMMESPTKRWTIEPEDALERRKHCCCLSMRLELSNSQYATEQHSFGFYGASAHGEIGVPIGRSSSGVTRQRISQAVSCMLPALESPYVWVGSSKRIVPAIVRYFIWRPIFVPLKLSPQTLQARFTSHCSGDLLVQETNIRNASELGSEPVTSGVTNKRVSAFGSTRPDELLHAISDSDDW